jgi:hypothetical protein
VALEELISQPADALWARLSAELLTRGDTNDG